MPENFQDIPGWQPVLSEFFASETGRSLQTYLKERKNAGAVIFPPDPFRALRLTAPDKVRCVILGQDPYHEKGQAQGLAFSVDESVKVPRSLRNIFNELESEFGAKAPESGDLSDWAKQGVLLLNTVFTVEEGKAASHAGRGWEELSDRIIRKIAEGSRPAAFLLWGGHAQKKRDLIEKASAAHLVLCCNHPSPLSARRPPVPFLGCGHFARVNAWLRERGEAEIQWLPGLKESEAAQQEFPGF